MKFFYLLIGFVAIISTQLRAQVYDSFDLDSLHDRWKGNRSHFVINQGSLQLNDTTRGGQSRLYAESSASTNVWWKLKFELKFNPSSSNYFNLIVAGVQDSLTLQVGRKRDGIQLIHRHAGQSELIMETNNGLLDLPQVKGLLDLRYLHDSTWVFALQLSSDTIVQSFSYEGFNGVVDQLILDCRYTKTRADKFLFEEIEVVGSGQQDVRPPTVLYVANTQDGTYLDVHWNEFINLTNASTFKINGKEVAVVHERNNEVRVGPLEEVKNGSDLVLMIENIADNYGNVQKDTVLHHSFYYAERLEFGDWKINEFMADPSPPLGLVETEYIELLNTSNKILETGGLSISDLSTTVPLKNLRVGPGQFVLLTKKEHEAAFEKIPGVMGLTSWPTLNNDRDVICLKSKGMVLDSLYYTLSWYRSEIKQKGGVALERIDSNFGCTSEVNWNASLDPSGGTPGKTNSIAAVLVDSHPPQIVLHYIEGGKLFLVFDEAISLQKDFKVLVQSQSCEVEQSAYNVLQVGLTIKPNQVLLVEVLGVADCMGNTMRSGPIALPVPIAPSKNKLWISEVLFDPYFGSVEFVELHHVGDQSIDLKGLLVKVNSKSVPIENHVLVHPDQFLVLSKSKVGLESFYGTIKESSWLSFDLPAMRNSDGIVVLELGKETIDSVYYAENMHHWTLQDHKGVSLERYRKKQDYQEQAKWISASSIDRFATPGRENSQRTLATDQIEVELKQRVFNPIQDALEIHFELPDPGFVGHLKVVNTNGLVVHTVLDGALLGVSGKLTWDGRSNGGLIKKGVYAIIMVIVGLDGSVHTIREPISVAY